MQSLRLGNSGFTLFEMMIVIAIIGIIYTFTIGFTENPSIYREKSIRLQSYIEDELKGARTNTMIGKGPKDASNNILLVQKRDVLISTGNIQTIYSGATNTGTERQIKAPFFEGDAKYKLNNFYGTCVDNSPFSGVTQAQITYEQTKDIQISNILPGAVCGGSSIRTITFEAQYQNYTGSVTLDRISGIISTKN